MLKLCTRMHELFGINVTCFTVVMRTCERRTVTWRGCMHVNKDGFVGHVCMCDEELCNGATGSRVDGLHVIIAGVWMGLLMLKMMT